MTVMAVQLSSVKKEVLKPAEKEKRVNKKERLGTILRYLKFAIVATCVALVIRQVAECIQKLVNTPISTYTHFDFNKTIEYPSLTFCREPAYKFDKLQKYGLYAHPRFTSVWRNFDFNKTSLQELWDDTTYNETEVFIQYGLDGERSMMFLTTSTLGFITGRCFTISPEVLGTRATRASGYSITLQHNRDDVMNNIGNFPPGYHVYVHYTREPFTEVEVYNGGLVDYLLLKIGETIDVKLTVDEYKKLNKEHDPCYVKKDNYSTNECTSRYIWHKVSEAVGCSGPWMRSRLPPCRDYAGMVKLISTYMRLYKSHDCSCPRLCHSHLYNAFVTDRHMYRWDVVAHAMVAKEAPRNNADLQIQLYVYFNALMVSVYEERYNYDWTHFVADLGGSIGFLLGLSVISLLTILGRLWAKVFEPIIVKEPQDLNTVSAAVEDQDTVHEKCKEWYLADVGSFI